MPTDVIMFIRPNLVIPLPNLMALPLPIPQIRQVPKEQFFSGIKINLHHRLQLIPVMANFLLGQPPNFGLTLLTILVLLKVYHSATHVTMSSQNGITLTKSALIKMNAKCKIPCMICTLRTKLLM